jgi:hypothetical protein
MRNSFVIISGLFFSVAEVAGALALLVAILR